MIDLSFDEGDAPRLIAVRCGYYLMQILSPKTAIEESDCTVIISSTYCLTYGTVYLQNWTLTFCVT